jgi:hypothetical protein
MHDDFAIHLKNILKHTVRGGMRWSEVERVVLPLIGLYKVFAKYGLFCHVCSILAAKETIVLVFAG